MSDAPIAGWYPDPKSPAAQWRWWDGSEWTAETSARPDAPVARPKDWGWDTPVVEVPPAKGKPVREPKAPREPKSPKAAAPELTENANTPWIWILAFSFFVVGTIAGAIQGVGFSLLGTGNGNTQLVSGVSIIVSIIVLIVLAELDGRALRKRGFPTASSLWVILIAPLVYFVVRGRKLRRVGARSRGPEIALAIVVILQIISVVAAVIFAAALVAVFSPGSPAIG